jgi:two-component system, OmpR family, response regulator
MSDKILNKILLVEDEEDIRVVFSFALEKLGKFTVKYCASGKEALQTAEAFAPDIILLDMMMPEMDGIQTLKALQQIPALSETPMVFITAKVQANEVEKYKALGAVDVIAKPFNPVLLPESLQKIWQEYQMQHTQKV